MDVKAQAEQLAKQFLDDHQLRWEGREQVAFSYGSAVLEVMLIELLCDVARRTQAETWREVIQFIYDACHDHGWDADEVMRQCERRALAVEGEP